MKLLKTLNPESVTDEEVKNYPIREAARAVVLDEEGNVAMLYASKFKYYKLPGGGVEAGEEAEVALQRECLEEIGCRVEIIHELGIVEEYRKFAKLRQISYCYLAKLKGEKGIPNFTEDETAEGFTHLWRPYSEVLELITENKTTDLEGHEYIVPRDAYILKIAQEYK